MPLAASGTGHIEIRPWRAEDLAAYQVFSGRWFGADAYQGRRRYLQWLYEDNPAGQGSGDCLVASSEDDAIVGYIHRMRLPWHWPGGERAIPTLHNLMVDGAHRSGAGYFLFKAALRGETHAVVPGVIGDLCVAYERMRYQRIPCRWYRKALHPLRLGLDWARARLGRRAPGPLPSDLTRVDGDARATTAPDPATLAWVADALNSRPVGHGGVAWTPALVAWRYFSSRGPRHALITSRRREFAILSIGPRHGIPVARLLAWSQAELTPRFVRTVERTDVRWGAALLLGYTANPAAAAALERCGIRALGAAPASFLLSRDRAIAPLVFDGGATDVGFEAIPRDNPEEP